MKEKKRIPVFVKYKYTKDQVKHNVMEWINKM